MTDVDEGRETLDRWTASGGRWEVLSDRGEEVVVGLFTCDGGEEMDRLTLPAAAIPPTEDPPVS